MAPRKPIKKNDSASNEKTAAKSGAASTAHLSGSVATATALRILLAHAGIRAPHTGEPLSEPMVFGLAGGIGMGVFAFRYEKADVSTFFIAGRHSWQDDLEYLRASLTELGIKPEVRETSSKRAAETQLREALATGGPCVAWVDSAMLPHRGMPERYQGGGYHVVTAYSIDEKKGSALIGDLADDPIELSLADLSAARARIVKQKNRLLWLPPSGGKERKLGREELARLVRAGIQRGLATLRSGAKKSFAGNFKLIALRGWADRLHGSSGKESWERIFPPGVNLWRGLTWLHHSIKFQGSGGGLCRPLEAEFLAEASQAIKAPALLYISRRYTALGSAWSGLADAALPSGTPLLGRSRALLEEKAEFSLTGAPPEAIRGVWRELDVLEREAADSFPLSASDCEELLAGLKERVLAIYKAENAALDELAAFAG